MSPSTEQQLRERVRRSIDSLNAGDPDPMLQMYSDDVIVFIPLYRPTDPAGDTVLRGKAAYREFLLKYVGHHRSYRVLDVVARPNGMLVSLECEIGERLTAQIEFDADGIARFVTIFIS